MENDLEERVTTLERDLAMSRRRWRRWGWPAMGACFVGVLAAALTVFADPTAALPCDVRFSGLFYCFSPDTPARADQVNHNFTAFAQWLEQKVGAPSADPAASTSGTGGLVVVGSPTSTNLALDGDEIAARQNGSASALTLQRGAAGSVQIGGPGPNTAAKLQVAGTVSAQVVEANVLTVGPGGTPLRKVVSGTYGSCSTPNSAGSTGVVPFGTTFSTAPLVFTQPEEPDGTGCTSVRIKSRSTSAFEFQAWVGGAVSPCDCIHWVAIGL